MDVELIKSLAQLSKAGVDVNLLLGQNQAKEEPKKEASETISFEDVLAMVQKKPEPKPEPKPASNSVAWDDVMKLIKASQTPAKEEPAPEPKKEESAAASISDEQFNKLLQAMNVKNVAIDVPDDNDWKNRLSAHFSELINGTNETKEEK